MFMLMAEVSHIDFTLSRGKKDKTKTVPFGILFM